MVTNFDYKRVSASELECTISILKSIVSISLHGICFVMNVTGRWKIVKLLFGNNAN